MKIYKNTLQTEIFVLYRTLNLVFSQQYLLEKLQSLNLQILSCLLNKTSKPRAMQEVLNLISGQYLSQEFLYNVLKTWFTASIVSSI